MSFGKMETQEQYGTAIIHTGDEDEIPKVQTVTFNAWTLRFDGAEHLEREYQEIRFVNSLRSLRLAGMGSIPFTLLLGGCGIENDVSRIKQTALWLLLGLVLPLVLLLGYSFTKRCDSRLMEFFKFLASVAGGFSIILWNKVELEDLETTFAVSSLMVFILVYSICLNMYFISSLVVSLVLLIVYGVLGLVEDSQTSWLPIFNILVLGISSLVVLYFNRSFDILGRKKFLVEQYNLSSIQKLKKETKHLKNELSRRELIQLEEEEKKEKLSLNSPIERVLEKLLQMKSRNLSIVDQQDIQYVYDTLANRKDIWSLDLRGLMKDGTMDIDPETRDWLFYEVVKEGDTKNDSPQTIPNLQNSIESNRLRNRTTSVSSLFPVVSPNKQHTLTELLRRDKEWDFDIFRLEELTGGRPLVFISKFLFKKHHILEKFKVNPVKMANFLEVVESGYRFNPYHSSTHAADVTLNCHYLIVKGGLINYFTDLDILSLLFAGIIHDYDHPGLNNSYQVNTESDLAVLYNNKSVLENHHASAALALLKEERYDFFPPTFTREERLQFKNRVIELVLATDMSLHYDILGHFKAQIASSGFDRQNPEHRLLLMKIAIKIADLSNCTKPKDMYLEWCDKIVEEMFQQGDREKDLNIPVSPFMDRAKPLIAKCQISFMTFVVLPLLEAYATFLKNKDFEPLQLLRENNEMWQQKERDAAITNRVPHLVKDNESSSEQNKILPPLVQMAREP